MSNKRAHPPDYETLSTSAEATEQTHYSRILNVFRQYKSYTLKALYKRYNDYVALTRRQQYLLQDDAYGKHLGDLRKCIEHNDSVLQAIIAASEGMFENWSASEEKEKYTSQTVSDFHIDKLYSTLVQIVRDWSEEGRSEREPVYTRIISAINARFAHLNAHERAGIRICVPGAGLARLPWELLNAGYSVEANEVSLFMAFVSNFILNRCANETNAHTIYPYIHRHSNVVNYADQLRPVAFPDIDTGAASRVLCFFLDCVTLSFTQSNALFTMSAGAFEDVYKREEHKNSWDVVVTVFMLDTAANPIDFIEIIFDILKAGGYWLNFGPLLYHYADLGSNNHYVELPLEEIRKVIDVIGFEVEHDDLVDNIRYVHNARSMLSYFYTCQYMIARKVTSDRAVKSPRQ